MRGIDVAGRKQQWMLIESKTVETSIFDLLCIGSNRGKYEMQIKQEPVAHGRYHSALTTKSRTTKLEVCNFQLSPHS